MNSSQGIFRKPQSKQQWNSGITKKKKSQTSFPSLPFRKNPANLAARNRQTLPTNLHACLLRGFIPISAEPASGLSFNCIRCRKVELDQVCRHTWCADLSQVTMHVDHQSVTVLRGLPSRHGSRRAAPSEPSQAEQHGSKRECECHARVSKPCIDSASGNACSGQHRGKPPANALWTC